MFDALVQDVHGLQQLCARLRAEPWIAVDTEFMRERTYYARLCLIQLATSTRVFCVDPLTTGDLEPLLDVLYRPEAPKIFHGARQDLEVFYHLRGSPLAPVFDTQIAAALVGFPEQISYAALVEALLGIPLAKDHTRTDWGRRPLQAEQLRYAEDDVRHLRELYLQLGPRLAALGRSAWLTEECARLTDSQLYSNDPESAFTRIKAGQTLPPLGQQVLRRLAAWRERVAKQRNLPRSWILRDAVLLELARTPPQSQAALLQVQGLSRANARRWGMPIFQAVASGRAAAPLPLWPEPKRPERAPSALYQRLSKLVKARACECGVSTTLLATRKDIQAVIAGDPDALLLTGWRRTLIGEELRATLADATCAPT